jgi:HPt (histidine-containing phosphotransfer) domain-containing protein
VSLHDRTLIDKAVFAKARRELGSSFIRIFGYFEEDGRKSVDAIEAAMRAKNAAALVMPAHTLKGEAHQFGADELGLVAEQIEKIARSCVETRDVPDEALELVVGLRKLFVATLSILQSEANPLVERRPGGLGRRSALGVNNAW